MGTGKFNSDDHFIYCCGQGYLRRSGVALIVNKRVWNAVPGCNLKNDRIISVHFQAKPFNITVIQIYAPSIDAKEAEVEQSYEDLQDLELTPKKDILFITGGWNAKGSQEIPGVSGEFGWGVQNGAEQRQTEFCQENTLVRATPSSSNTRDDSTRGHRQTVSTEIRLMMVFTAEDGEALHG